MTTEDRQESPGGGKPTDDRANTAPDLPPELAKTLKPAESKEHESKQSAPGQIISPGDKVIEDQKTDEAVDEIWRSESDTVLAVEDVAHQPPPMPPRSFWQRVGGFFKAWVKNPWARWATIIVVTAVVLTVGMIPRSRYWTLNLFGVRSSASVTVLDDATRLPLKNVKVTINGASAQTDIKGFARVKNVRLGPQTLTISRVAFANIKRNVVIGWGSNPLGEFSLKATGLQYFVRLTDYLSGKPVVGAEATDAKNGDNTALSDKNGLVTFTSDSKEPTDLAVIVRAKDYRDEQLTLKAASQGVPGLEMVVAKKHLFVANTNGRYDVWSTDIDGKNKKLVLAGTGRETKEISLAANDAGTMAALVSTRDDARDSDGYLLKTLTIIDLERGSNSAVEHAEQIQLVDWVGDKLVYQLTVAGASEANSQRNRVMVYDPAASKRVQLAGANQFNAVISAKGFVYYAPSSTDPSAKLGLFRVKPDSPNTKTRVFNPEVWSAFRTTYDTLLLQTPSDWYSFNLGPDTSAKISAPTAYTNRMYVAGPSGANALWVNNTATDTLMVYDTTSKRDRQLHVQEGVNYPLRWLMPKVIAYRLDTQAETADYVLSLDGGQPKKIANVVSTYGFTQAY